MATPTVVKSPGAVMQAELLEELRQAEQDFARGELVEITIEELDRFIAAGKWPWPEGSSEQGPRSGARGTRGS